MVQEQCEADADTSVQQRLLAGAGTAVKGTGEALIEEGEGNKDTKIAGGIDLILNCSQSVYFVWKFITNVPSSLTWLKLALVEKLSCMLLSEVLKL